MLARGLSHSARFSHSSKKRFNFTTRVRASHSTMALNYPRPIEINPSGPHTSTFIMLHGLGDTGDGWSDIGYMYKASLPGTKFIFPHAPRRPITLNFGMSMPGWYDIASLEDIQGGEDGAGLRESQRYVEELIQREIAAGIPSTKIVIGGFSQGGAVALMMLRSSIQLGGVVALSAYVPLHKEQPLVSEANSKTPIFMCHGDADQTVAFEFGRRSYQMLLSLDANVEFQTYLGMAHSACQREFDDVLAFVKPILV
ncbi:hypothetical protein VOLCADRAFT_81547 [Volvox carteri f. nagariensis]|uniref:Phospholipase/carboxylesterase/thioesterase domain-containing protein n=1 Tax=Volvox carteri f. nagariensis TaxID=3068 RepID=D8TZ14_VOLCA|nr:uncharacterized protein VOLCADRAFT_81547 [Volvox carteri f. nagariensis]EFJ47101.1 hypothetical protein VOLCADRAFT_81547 [Volvox carteri f. nagariensis]|eukprot:XP_002951650.1 hypothetical protein VOLCADRAFT_81547 [Volvox carteri f. nagariensis]